MGTGSWLHWAILLVVVILIFGTKKLPNVGGDIAKAVKSFKDGLKGEDDKPAAPAPTVADKTTIDVDAKEKSKQ